MIRFIAILVAGFFTAMAPTTADAQSTYRARSGDVLIIEVLEDTTLNRSVIILPDGEFSFPFAGTVRGSGKTVGEIEASIARAIAPNFASPPTVFVSLQPDRSEIATGEVVSEPDLVSIYFLGEVAQPGIREVKPGTTFLQAMSQAGGLTRFAATKRIQLRRTDKNGRQTVESFNYKAMAQGASVTQKDPKLREGDVILVPERRLFE